MEDHTLRDTVEDMQPGRTQEEDGAYSFSAGSGQEKTGIEGQSMSGMDPGQEKSSAEKGAEAEKNDRREAGKSAFVEELISWIKSFRRPFSHAVCDHQRGHSLGIDGRYHYDP